MPKTTEPTERIRLRTPGDIAAAVPLLVGFQPAESLVVVTLRGRRRRVGLTMRLDLPGPGCEETYADVVASHVGRAGAAQVVLVCVTEDPGDRPRAALVDAVRGRLAGIRVETSDALLVRDGRWESYLCDDPGCCLGGRPLPEVSTQLAAALAFEGRAVLPDRAALVASLAPAGGLAATLMGSAMARERAARAAAPVDPLSLRRARAERLDAFAAALDEVVAGGPVGCDEAARLVVSLDDVVVRDTVLSWALRRPDELRALLTDLARRAVPPGDAPVCATLGWVAYVAGDGTTAGVLVERALRGDPSYSLALLLDDALRRQVPPRELRRVLVQTARDLRRRRA